MINEIIDGLEIRDWKFQLQTVHSCTLTNETLDLTGALSMIDTDDVLGAVSGNFVQDDLLVKSSIAVEGNKWVIAVYKNSEGAYASTALLELYAGSLLLVLRSTNMQQFSAAQKELAIILKHLDVSGIQVDVFDFGKRFKSKAWRYNAGRLICENGVCNVAADQQLDTVLDQLSKRYNMVVNDSDKKYYKFKGTCSEVQLWQVDNIIFYAICDHETPLYDEIQEV